MMFAPLTKFEPETTNGWALVDPNGDDGATPEIEGVTTGATTVNEEELETFPSGLVTFAVQVSAVVCVVIVI